MFTLFPPERIQKKIYAKISSVNLQSVLRTNLRDICEKLKFVFEIVNKFDDIKQDRKYFKTL